MGHEQWSRQFHSEQVDRQVALRGPDEHSRHQPPAIEGRDIGVLCALIAATASHIGHDALRKNRMGLCFELLEPYRKRRDAAAQAGNVDFVLVVTEMRHDRFLQRQGLDRRETMIRRSSDWLGLVANILNVTCGNTQKIISAALQCPAGKLCGVRVSSFFGLGP
jgi:hypothetical protein